MEPEQRQPYKVFRAGSRSFPVCLEYDEQLDESYPCYPDFEKPPGVFRKRKTLCHGGTGKSCSYC